MIKISKDKMYLVRKDNDYTYDGYFMTLDAAVMYAQPLKCRFMDCISNETGEEFSKIAKMVSSKPINQTPDFKYSLTQEQAIDSLANELKELRQRVRSLELTENSITNTVVPGLNRRLNNLEANHV